MLFDSHCHINARKFDADRDAVFRRMKEAGVEYAVCVGDDMENSRQCIDLARKNPGWIYATVGVHPHEAKDFKPEDLHRLREWTKEPEVVAIGEIGLDYHYDFSPRETQREVFIMQLDLAAELDFPVVYHVREAQGDTLALLKETKKLPTGIMHCYAGSLESAEEYMALGQYISFSGSVTFKNAHKLRRVAEFIPLDRMLIETDAPYLSPEPLRGRRNEPAYVEHIARCIAALRSVDYEELCAITLENAKRVFRIE